MTAHSQEFGSDNLPLLTNYVGQVGIISLTNTPVFTYLNVEQDKVTDSPGNDIMADAGEGLA